MGHFVKNKKTFNAYIDRLINLDFDESDESEEHPNDNSVDSAHSLINNSKSDKLN